MSSPSHPKRRRLNNANALSRPFVSPVRRDAKTADVDTKQPQPRVIPAAATGNASTYTPSTLAHSITTSHLALGSDAQSSIRGKLSTVAKASHSSRPSFATSRSSFTSSKRTKVTPEEQAVQKAITALEYEIKGVRNDLDALTQAQRLATSTKDVELEALRLKWVAASQEAAEELFGELKERVMRMGGVSAWKDSEKQKFDRSHGRGDFAQSSGFAEPEDDDADCEFDSDGEELPEAEQAWRKAEKVKAKREREDAADPPDEPEQSCDVSDGGGKEVWREDGEDDDAFTIDMMLRSLNIDLSIIGWNREMQQWTTLPET